MGIQLKSSGDYDKISKYLKKMSKYDAKSLMNNADTYSLKALEKDFGIKID